MTTLIKRWVLVSIGLCLALPATALAAVSQEPGIGLPRDMSKHGHLIDSLLIVTLYVITGLFAIMVGWMVIAIVKHGKNHEAEYNHGTAKKGQMAILGVALGIFVFADGNLFINSTMDLHNVFHNWELAQPPEGLKIEINARQWAWQFRYPGADGEFGTADDVTTLNDFRVPNDTPIMIQLTASDVLHAFYMPNFRVKIDAVPGMINPVWFHPTETGEYDIGCAQHCGTHHYKMKGKITVMERADYDRWFAEATINSKLDYQEARKGVEAKYNPHWGWKWETL